MVVCIESLHTLTFLPILPPLKVHPFVNFLEPLYNERVFCHHLTTMQTKAINGTTVADMGTSMGRVIGEIGMMARNMSMNVGEDLYEWSLAVILKYAR